ncbi:MAG: CHRD domain-containing protein [Clostridiales bacterium]|nr:CHRD domain-containing protein [Clostridiales bacterium]
MEGQPFSELLNQMQAGNTYVNVHTKRHPAGEIRGQISHSKKKVRQLDDKSIYKEETRALG